MNMVVQMVNDLTEKHTLCTCLSSTLSIKFTHKTDILQSESEKVIFRQFLICICVLVYFLSSEVLANTIEYT